MIYRNKFKVGDKVTWRSQKWANQAEVASSALGKYLGSGPFKITKIKALTGDFHAVGHTQWVSIDVDCDLWSGAYFKKVEETHG